MEAVLLCGPGHGRRVPITEWVPTIHFPERGSEKAFIPWHCSSVAELPKLKMVTYGRCLWCLYHDKLGRIDLHPYVEEDFPDPATAIELWIEGEFFDVWQKLESFSSLKGGG
jgi:hypothetical protein